jgi:hypothetical protein
MSWQPLGTSGRGAEVRAILGNLVSSGSDANNATEVILMRVENTCTSSKIPYKWVQAGILDPTTIPPIPPPGEGWYLFTYGMSDQLYTWVGSPRRKYLGWLWQRVVPESTADSCAGAEKAPASTSR